ncbi:MAG: helix-turn-helix transcriptional regulator [Pseudonocardiaceae bacterium]
MDTVKAKRHALVQRREILGHSQETLAQELGVEPTTVGRWERGETSPQPWARPKLADALAVSLEELDRLLSEGQPPKAVGTSDTPDEPANDPEHDPVLSAPWNHRGTVMVAVMLRGGLSSGFGQLVWTEIDRRSLDENVRSGQVWWPGAGSNRPSDFQDSGYKPVKPCVRP